MIALGQENIRAHSYGVKPEELVDRRFYENFNYFFFDDYHFQ